MMYSQLFIILLLSLITIATPHLDKQGTLKPRLFVRENPSSPGNASSAIGYGSLFPRNDCLPGADICGDGSCCFFNCCPTGQCCDYPNCCLDGLCCGAAQTCYNDAKGSNGPSFCCEDYTEAQCDSGCMPFDATCCGDSSYCLWNHVCVTDGCCEIGKTCTGGLDDSDQYGAGSTVSADDTISSTYLTTTGEATQQPIVSTKATTTTMKEASSKESDVNSVVTSTVKEESPSDSTSTSFNGFNSVETSTTSIDVKTPSASNIAVNTGSADKLFGQINLGSVAVIAVGVVGILGF